MIYNLKSIKIYKKTEKSVTFANSCIDTGGQYRAVCLCVSFPPHYVSCVCWVISRILCPRLCHNLMTCVH